MLFEKWMFLFMPTYFIIQVYWRLGRGFEKIMNGVRMNPDNRPKYYIDDEGVMVLYEVCK